MFFQRFYDDGLAQSSYVIACQQTGDAIVLDPNRDIEQYVACAEREGFRIAIVTETHIHADFVSGSRELGARTGARLALSGEGGTDWQYAFATRDRVRVLRDGDRIDLGLVRLDVLHTPGHTPEHLAFLVTDGAASDRPLGLISGDFVFVGDVGRPDLLEKAAKVEGSMEGSARELFHSLKRFRALPDWVQLWPGHGAGSACGKALGAMPQSTVGYERIANWAMAVDSEDVFVREVLSGQPDPPSYFAEMKRINREGPPVLGAAPAPPRLEARGVAGRSGARTGARDATRASEALLIDVRPTDRFAAGHIPGSLNLPLGRSLASWAGWLVPYDRDLLLLAESQEDANAAGRHCSLIGLDRIRGWFAADALDAWSAARGPLGASVQTTPAALEARLRHERVTILDVRNDDEWREGHLPGAIHIPLGQLEERLTEIPQDAPLVVQCQGGTRSAIAASLLQANGIRVENLEGGFRAWAQDALPIAREPRPV